MLEATTFNNLQNNICQQKYHNNDEIDVNLLHKYTLWVRLTTHFTANRSVIETMNDV